MNTTPTIEWSPADMVEIYLETPDDFLKVRETLSRIGIESKREPYVLFQTAHILHKRGRYYIVHFKELFLLDLKPSTFTLEDLSRRNAITTLLQDWGLLKVANIDMLTPVSDLKKIKIVSHKEKKEWDLRPKYSIGKTKY
jgi:hypothetical protein